MPAVRFYSGCLFVCSLVCFISVPVSLHVFALGDAGPGTTNSDTTNSDTTYRADAVLSWLSGRR